MTDAKPLERPDAFTLALNYWPFMHLACGLAVGLSVFQAPGERAACMAAWLYLLPPLLARLTLLAFGRPAGRLTLDMPAYRVWWFLTQLQQPFNRLPWLEELLRLVPGLYPSWIKLWGGRMSLMAFVGPGVLITDRHAVVVARGAVLGMKSTLAGHMAIRDADGRFVVVAGAPTVESGAIVGGHAVLGPGATLRAGHLLPSGRRVAPFQDWPRSNPEPQA
ncbi:MAG: hypothetical protein RLY71_1867 [Pseudomonadota bacterium]|jgi:hypothetical protein